MPGVLDDPALALHVAITATPFSPDKVSELKDDFLRCLEVANVELNGGKPSDSFSRVNESVIVELAPAISDLIVDGLNRIANGEDLSNQERQLLVLIIRQVALGWAFVLAGDIDAIVKEVVRASITG
jgi:hypothetical protein